MRTLPLFRPQPFPLFSYNRTNTTNTKLKRTARIFLLAGGELLARAGAGHEELRGYGRIRQGLLL
ncbi:hypothetical protein J2Z66_002024 [Paenibacillus eucommiae]|uniref:Uncharacterized protein n=1 Tax=Paenibacillus eucommiae TaxID=1355755 RepID=A0ABS4ISC3_9BACL|nr:hypothetical protein [Paenibacillus eucommiae]